MWILPQIHWHAARVKYHTTRWHHLADNTGRMLCGKYIPPGAVVADVRKEKPDGLCCKFCMRKLLSKEN